MALLSMIKSLWMDIASWKNFQSSQDWLKWMTLRLQASRLGGRDIVAQGTTSIAFRGDASSLSLRKGTSDFLVLREIFILGEYDSLKHLSLPRNPKIVDLGANIGAFLFLAARFWPQAEFLAVEPDHCNFDLLTRNIQSLGNRVETVRECVGGRSGHTDLNRDGGEWAIRMTDIKTNGEVPVEEVGSLLNRFGFDHVSLMKCDVEGAEEEIFANCRDWIGQVDNLIIELHGDYKISDLQTDLRAAGASFTCTGEGNDRPTYLLTR